MNLEKYRSEFGTKENSGLIKLLGFIEADPFMKEKGWVAYVLATVYHETGRTFEPVKEKGGHDYFIKRYGGQTKVGKSLGNDTPEEGAIYAGRGYAQDTGETNYERDEKVIRSEYPGVVERFEKRTGKRFDLTVGDQPGDASDPDNLLDPQIAYCVMSVSMRKGLYTGVGLPKFINRLKCDFVNARKIVNGLDCAQKIAGYAMKFMRCL